VGKWMRVSKVDAPVALPRGRPQAVSQGDAHMVPWALSACVCMWQAPCQVVVMAMQWPWCHYHVTLESLYRVLFPAVPVDSFSKFKYYLSCVF
jgi:hypothetical protein